MADNSTGLNVQYDRPFFPGIDSGAQGRYRSPGSPGDSPSESAGPVVGSPVISAPYGSSQLPANRPTLAVTSGDTSGMSSDQAAQASPITPGPASAFTDTGAGAGNPEPYDHPSGYGRWARAGS